MSAPTVLRVFVLLAAVAALGSCRGGGGVAGGETSPFPLREGARWTYDGRFQGTVYRTTLVLLPVTVDERRSWAFYDAAERVEGQLLMGNMFADDLFRWDGDRLLVADEHRPDDEHVLLQVPLREGDATEYRVGMRVTRCVVQGEERIVVPAGTFLCRRLSVTEERSDGRVSEHTVWLAPGVGLVRWDRSTGRVDELVHHAP